MSEPAEPIDMKASRNLVRDLPQTRSPQYMEVYSNNIGLAANFYDVTIIFGKVVVSQQGIPVVENTTAVAMAWEHAKALAAGLSRAVEAYEKEHATTIRKPPSAD
jgi:hypothetical protein